MSGYVSESVSFLPGVRAENVGVMRYFDSFVSNTTAGSGNQYVFESDCEKHTGLLFYRLTCGGRSEYSLLFSDTLDSTFADGSVSCANLCAGGFTLHSAAVCITGNPDASLDNAAFTPLSFAGRRGRTLSAGELVSTDPVGLEAAAGEYLCVRLEFSGRRIPYHEESLIPTFVLEDGRWKPSKRLPFLSMLGCKRRVKAKLGFWGDSITQGIGTPFDSYTHYAARVAELLGNAYAYHDLGLGYARAEDAASDGVWAYKAAQNELVSVCFGVNDILRGRSESDIKRDLLHIVERLTGSGVHVLIQSVPPFDYSGENIGKWKRINAYIREVIAPRADLYFDNTAVLSDPSAPERALYGGHPNAEGCSAWAEALAPLIARYFEKS